MSGAVRRSLRCAALFLAALALGGCSNPDAPGAGRGSGEEPRVASPGEPNPPPPPAASRFTAAELKQTPVDALGSFASLYVDWSYRDLTRRQRELAAISVGAARSAELQAAASGAADGTLRAAHLANSGTVVSIAQDHTQTGRWVIVTHEQTSGSGGYEGLPAAYHVTLARVASVPGGYAVSEWLPQS
jgi:hypothetical protein